MPFGEKLKAVREAAGLTQIALAEKSGVPVGTIRDYEQVKRAPLLTTAAKLARALGVSVEVFTESVLEDEEPAGREAAGPGRPPKPTAAKPEAAEPAKRPRGRPRKGKPSS